MPPETTTHAPALPCVGWIRIGERRPFLHMQWCYTENLEVEAGSKSVVTACGIICSLPTIGITTRVPTCPECIALGEMVADELGDDNGE